MPATGSPRRRLLAAVVTGLALVSALVALQLADDDADTGARGSATGSVHSRD